LDRWGVTSSEHVRDAFDLGASGVQVGTLFAYCDESGWTRPASSRARRGKGWIGNREDVAAGFVDGISIQVASVEDTISDPDVYDHRERKCDLGYLREAYLKPNGSTAIAARPSPSMPSYERVARSKRPMDRLVSATGLWRRAG